jgi:hypothetical protein
MSVSDRAEWPMKNGHPGRAKPGQDKYAHRHDLKPSLSKTRAAISNGSELLHDIDNSWCALHLAA